ncbi:MAG: cbb3-type cytochrome c oxidase subunit II [Cyanobacteria bacterium NC_groundwater_1444_Ag_S-0.65um_54_12]|nr:cbb3-type cytochrome c oxidase subunit II [Cyanobacteria bacterium NC_groundwater_1444_Ag_S-0.65um_54_12]
MIRLWVIVIGAVAFMTFALAMLVIVPKAMLGEVRAPDGLVPYSEAALRGRAVYVANGCIYCHSQQVRDASFTNDERRGWGRPSLPADYFYDNPHLLGTSRTGPDLFNVGVRLPDINWHLLHLYQPRAVAPWSIMPAFGYLFAVKDTPLPGDRVIAVPANYRTVGKVVVAKSAAIDLASYLIGLRHTYQVPASANESHGH